MKIMRTEYSLYEIPELEEADFEFSVPACRRIEDANNAGYMGDSISMAVDFGESFSTFDA